jgi:ribosomal-protein-alanine N-acetyltransferase
MIRPFFLSDLDRILQIEARAFPKSPYDWATFINLHSIYPETFLVYVDTTCDMKVGSTRFREGPLLGYIVYSTDGHIISIAVHPNHRRRGIGNELLKRAINIPNVKKIWAEVRKSNRIAQAFYSRAGFQMTGVVPNYYGNEDALIVEWTSSASEP